MSGIGLVGLGSMGAAIARHLHSSRVPVTCWNRSAQPRRELAAEGVSVTEDLSAVLRQPVVLSILANGAASKQVFSAERLRQYCSGSTHVALETLSVGEAAAAAKRHNEAGVLYLAAPVIGRPDAAGSGRLNVIAAGPAETFAQVQPVLDVIATKTWYFGADPSRANLVKAGVNFNLIHTLQALGESIALMESGGVDAGDFVNLLTGTLYPGPAYAGYGDLIARRSYAPARFSVELGLKDLRLAEAIAAEGGVDLPTAPAIRDIFERTLADPELASLDWSALAETIRKGARK